jgi:D-beta-D-heptose 7-phosphate kinase/D-beta-D-heptose 1-phosphate adenosyltransferase
MLDRFVRGRVTRISPEAPVPVVTFQSEEIRLGGAANVANNIAALGGRPVLVGVVGSDATGAELRRELTACGIEDATLAADRRTTEKVRVVTDRNQQVARIDYEQDGDVDEPTERALVATIDRVGANARALVVSDYLKGVVTPRVASALLAFKRPSIPLIVDPKVAHLASYAGASLVTPNHHETEAATHRRTRTVDDVREAALMFRKQVGCEGVLVTRGEDGMWLSTPQIEGAIPAAAREVADVTGAGDTVVASLALAFAAGASVVEAAVLANTAAGMVVGKFGVATVTREELLATLQRGSAEGVS